MRRLEPSELLELHRNASGDGIWVKQTLEDAVVSVKDKDLVVGLSVTCPLVTIHGCVQSVRFTDLKLGIFIPRQRDFILYRHEGMIEWNDPWPRGTCQNCGVEVGLVVRLAYAFIGRAFLREVTDAYISEYIREHPVV